MQTKQIEQVADRRRCEMCGALIVDGETDRPPDDAAELVRRLAFIADVSPSLAILLVHHIARRTEREIAAKLKVSPSAIHKRIVRARRAISSIEMLGGKQSAPIYRGHCPGSLDG